MLQHVQIGQDQETKNFVYILPIVGATAGELTAAVHMLRKKLAVDPG